MGDFTELFVTATPSEAKFIEQKLLKGQRIDKLETFLHSVRQSSIVSDAKWRRIKIPGPFYIF